MNYGDSNAFSRLPPRKASHPPLCVRDLRNPPPFSIFRFAKKKQI